VATVTVPPPLQEQLGDAAAESLAGMFDQLEAARQQERETHKEQLFELLEERFLRHVAESEGRLRGEIAEVRAGTAESESRLRAEIADVHKEITHVHKQIGDLRGDMSEQITDVHRQITDVHKQIARQTRWTLTVLGGAAVLFPIIQRVMAVLLP